MVETSARHQTICQAADWFIRMQAGEISGVEQARYWKWLRRSPAHIAETLRISRLRTELMHLRAFDDSSLVQLPRNTSSALKGQLAPSRSSGCDPTIGRE